MYTSDVLKVVLHHWNSENWKLKVVLHIEIDENNFFSLKMSLNIRCT